MIIYVPGSLFDAPAGSILAHACNGQGVWGGGIALAFKNLYPAEYRLYYRACRDGVVDGDLVMANNVACMITSSGYGPNRDPIESILNATRVSFRSLLEEAVKSGKEIHMPKINSGIFGVPWHLTEKVLVDVLTKFDEENGTKTNIYVWTPN